MCIVYTQRGGTRSLLLLVSLVMEELDMDSGTADMKCDCSSSNYTYEPCGHVIKYN